MATSGATSCPRGSKDEGIEVEDVVCYRSVLASEAAARAAAERAQVLLVASPSVADLLARVVSARRAAVAARGGADDGGGVPVVGLAAGDGEREAGRQGAGDGGQRTAAMTLDPRPSTLSATLALAILCGPMPLSAQNYGYLSDTARVARLSTEPRPGMSCPPAPDTTIMVFDEASGRPLRAIGGPSTCLGAPEEVAARPNGELYVLGTATPRGSSFDLNAVTVFAPGASGNTAPRRRFFVPRNLDGRTKGFGLDRRGNAYVQSEVATKSEPWGFIRPVPAIHVYRSGADSMSTPTRTITGRNTTLGDAFDITFDSRGNMYVAQRWSPLDRRGSLVVRLGQISIFSRDPGGDTLPLRTIRSPAENDVFRPSRLAIGPGDTLFVLSTFQPKCFTDRQLGMVMVYPPTANGKVEPVRTLPIVWEGKPAPDSVDTPNGIAVDERGYLYVSVNGPHAVLVYPPGARGKRDPSGPCGGPDTPLRNTSQTIRGGARWPSTVGGWSM